MVVAQDTNAPEQDTGREGQEPVEDVVRISPLHDGVITAPPRAMNTSTASPHSQPASQHTQSKDCTVQSNDSVTLGAVARPTEGGGGGGSERVLTRVDRQECVHDKAGTCSVHGPGAKWRWRPIPPHKRTIGPDGKTKKREYFWSCEVGVGGRNLQQAKLKFKRNDDEEPRGDNGGPRDNKTMG